MLDDSLEENLSDKLEASGFTSGQREIMQTLLEQKWSPELKRIYSKYPSILRSQNFDAIRRKANSGDSAGAEELAQQIQARNPRMRIENIIARRMRVERASLFTRLSKAERGLRDVFNRLGSQLADKVGRKADAKGNLPYLYASVHDTAVALGRELRTWMTSLVRDSAQMALDNAGNAFLPIFKDNWESIMLQEDKLSFGLDKKFANRTDPRIGKTSSKWRDKVSKIVFTQAKSNLKGQSFSQNIWDLTKRSEMDMKKLLANEIANGTSPDTIARKIKKYMSPSITSADELTGPLPRGVYASPFKNAWRLARTEAGTAYTNASAEFAKDNKWITGVRVTLSPIHSEDDICDEYAARGVMTPEEFSDLIPAHPHCMCYPTFCIDDKFLAEVE
jgi:hypothetical protein